MSDARWSAVDRYITDLLVRPDKILEATLAASTAAGLPPISVSASQGKLLQLLVCAMRARRVLEIGTLGGYSAIWMGRGLPADGRLITLEADPVHARVARANVEAAGLSAIIEVRLGLAIDTLPQLAAEAGRSFDVIFIDADKEGYPDYLRWSLELARPGGLILADNVVRDGRVVDESASDPAVQGVRRFNELVAAEPRVSATAIQTVGSKGYDGFAVMLVS